MFLPRSRGSPHLTARCVKCLAGVFAMFCILDLLFVPTGQGRYKYLYDPFNLVQTSLAARQD